MLDTSVKSFLFGFLAELGQQHGALHLALVVLLDLLVGQLRFGRFYARVLAEGLY